MAIWIHYNQAGFGIRKVRSGTPLTYRTNGHSFVPAYEPQGWDEGTWDFGTVSTTSPTSTFNAANFQPGHELIHHVLVFRFNTPQSGYIYAKWYNPDNELIWDPSYLINQPVPPGPTYELYIHQFIGIKDGEIDMDGAYRVDFSGLVSGSFIMTVNNLDTSLLTEHSTTDRGYMWIDGRNLRYISYMRHQQKMLYSGSTYGFAGVANKGHIWISNNDYRIYWVDENGYVRRSKIADHYGFLGAYSWPKSTSSANKGYTWMDNGWWDCIVFVAYDGQLCRAGNGYIYGDMQ